MAVYQPVMDVEEKLQWKSERDGPFRADIFHACMIDTNSFQSGAPGV